MNRWTWFLVLSVGLLTGPAVTAISYGFPSAGNNGDQIDEDGKKIKEKKEKAGKKAAEAKKKWEKKQKDKGGEDDGSENNDSGDSSSDSSDSSGGSESDSGDDSSDGGSDDGGSPEESSDDSSSDESTQDDDSSEESGGEDNASSGEEDDEEESGNEEESSEETEPAEEETTEEEVVEETVEEPAEEEEVVEEYVEYVEPMEEYPEGTFPDSYFIDRPAEKFQLQKYHITDPDGNRLMSIKEGEEVEIDYSLRNIQQKKQTYVMIAQIIDQQGVTIDMGWYVDTIQSGEYADWYGFWTPDAPGLCTIKIMVWDGIDEDPAPITKITEMTVLVHQASP